MPGKNGKIPETLLVKRKKEKNLIVSDMEEDKIFWRRSSWVQIPPLHLYNQNIWGPNG